MSAQCCMTQVPVVQNLDNAIHWISLYVIGFPVDNGIDSTRTLVHALTRTLVLLGVTCLNKGFDLISLPA